MPVYKDRNGSWYVSYTYKDLVTGKFRKRNKRGFRTSKEAKQWERENYISETNGSDLTFREAVDKYEEFMQTSPDTKRKHHEHFNIRFNSFLDRPISKITKEELISWRAELAKMDFSTRTKNCTIGLVKSVFKYYSDVYSVSNPSSLIKKFKSTDEEVMEEMHIWTPDEFLRFISCVDDPEMHAYFNFLFWTGCRRGEAVALQIKDVSDGWAMIRYSQTNQVGGLKPTKTRQRRKIQLDDILWSEIKPLLNKKTPYVFGGEKGLSISPIKRTFLKAIKDSGLNRIRIHDLRHSHASWLINNGVNIVAVSKRLGHANIEQTLKTYTHLLESSDQNMMLKINEYRAIGTKAVRKNDILAIDKDEMSSK